MRIKKLSKRNVTFGQGGSYLFCDQGRNVRLEESNAHAEEDESDDEGRHGGIVRRFYHDGNGRDDDQNVAESCKAAVLKAQIRHDQTPMDWTEDN